MIAFKFKDGVIYTYTYFDGKNHEKNNFKIQMLARQHLKQIENSCWCQFSNKYDFNFTTCYLFMGVQ